MSGVGWKLRRLGAMGPGEILHRARVALRDRLAPPDYARLAPDEAYDRLFAGEPRNALAGGRLEPFVQAAKDGSGFAAVIADAATLAAGRWSLFGHPVTLADPPQWNRHPLTGAAWPELASEALDFRRTDVAGGAKYTWELGRLTMLPTLALAARVTGNPELARPALAWLDDFVARNPLGRGLHHTSGIEMAIRIVTMSWTLALLRERIEPERARRTLGLIAQQALWCRDHLSLGSSANNHLLAEYAGMVVAGAAWPAMRESESLLGEGLGGLAREVPRQIHADGVPGEQAFAYLPFVWELLLPALMASEAAGRSVPREVRERLAASLEFARALRLPDGRLPAVGDEDDGRVLLAADGLPRLDLAGNALAAWLDAPALSALDVLARLLTGTSTSPRAAAPGRHDFPSGGWTAWRHGVRLVTFDHAPLGLGSLAAHGHADALAITVHHGTTPIVVDPGTFAYHEEPEARDGFRSTAAHATVSFGGRCQSEMLGPFLWGARARVAAAGAAWECVWATGERHRRHVAVEADTIAIEDVVEGDDPRLIFPLHPEARVELDGRDAAFEVRGVRGRIAGEGIGAWRLEPASYSPRFGHRAPAQRLVAPIDERKARTFLHVPGGS